MKRIELAAGLSFFCVLLSLSAYLLHWRVANEPGAGDAEGILLAHRILLSSGLAALVYFTIKAVRTNSFSAKTILLPVLISILCYLPVLGLTILMMV